MKLSIIIPAYNEEKSISKTLKEMNSYLIKQKYEYEILVVNDGSKDNTAQIVKGLIPKIKNLELIDNKKNKGKGGVVKQGMLAGKGEHLLFTDADHATNINHLEKVWPEIEKGFKVVIGSRDSRDHPDAQQANPQPKWKRMMGDIGNLAIQILLLPGIWDTQCGFKVFEKQLGQKLFSQSKGFRWAFDVEMLALAKKMKQEIRIVPTYWINNPNSRFRLKGYIRFFKEFFHIYWNFLTKQYKHE